jgi:hypothetical protein
MEKQGLMSLSWCEMHHRRFEANRSGAALPICLSKLAVFGGAMAVCGGCLILYYSQSNLGTK